MIEYTIHPSDFAEHCEAARFELDAYDPAEDLTPPDLSTDTVFNVFEEVAANVWLAESYARQNAPDLARECAAAAFQTWRQFHDVLTPYDGQDFRDRVVRVALSLQVPGAARCLLTH